MLKFRLEEIEKLKERATALRNRGAHDRANKILDQAIQQLKTFSEDPGLDQDSAKEVRAALADTYGMKGGIFRRLNQPQAALEQYKEGCKIEKLDKQSTYNLSNFITLRITEMQKSPKAPELLEDIDEAIDQLEKETKSSRKDEWWGWADLGQFYLLRNEPDKARAAYLEGRQKSGPTAAEVKRHIDILGTLAQATVDTAPEVSGSIEAVITDLTPYAS